jgi:hypothetical protein
VRLAAWAEHGRASVDRQSELVINRYAIALDWSRAKPDVRSHGSVRPGRAVRLRADGQGPPAPSHAKTYNHLTSSFASRGPVASRSGCAEHHRRGRQDHPPRRAPDDPSDVARTYERADLDDMRARRKDSVDVYACPATTSTTSSARPSACSTRGARRHQGAQLVETVHRLGGSTRASLPPPSLCAIPHARRSGRTCSGAGCGWVSMCTPGICITRPPHSGAVRRPAGARRRVRCRVVGERLDTVQART